MKKSNSILIPLHILLAVYSISNVFSKLAAQQEFLSLGWLIDYGAVLMILAVYAVGWQQIIKRMPLTAAYANRAVTVIWGFVWGILFFNESITAGKIIGILVVFAGVMLYTFADRKEEETK